MSRRELKVIQYRCDNPDCGQSLTVENEDDEFIGLKGDVFEVTGTHGGGAEWFACSRECVGPAVASALDKTWGEKESD